MIEPEELQETCDTCCGIECDYCNSHNQWKGNTLYHYIINLIRLINDQEDLIKLIKNTKILRRNDII